MSCSTFYISVLAAFGFPEYPYGCVDRECDRDSVCLKRAKAALKKSHNAFEVNRYVYLYLKYYAPR